MRKHTRKVIESASDIVTDTALILQRVGVVCNDFEEVSKAVHSVDAQQPIDYAAELFFNRKQQGLITLTQLLGTLQSKAA